MKLVDGAWTEEYESYYMMILYDEFIAKYWDLFDSDNSGSLNFDECMYTLAGVAYAYARRLIKVRK